MNASDTKVPLGHFEIETPQMNVSDTKVPLQHLESLWTIEASRTNALDTKVTLRHLESHRHSGISMIGDSASTSCALHWEQSNRRPSTVDSGKCNLGNIPYSLTTKLLASIHWKIWNKPRIYQRPVVQYLLEQQSQLLLHTRRSEH
jgi:hypothetical protein